MAKVVKRRKLQVPKRFFFKQCNFCFLSQEDISTQVEYCAACNKAFNNICTCKKYSKCRLCIQLDLYKTDFSQWLKQYVENTPRFEFMLCDVCLTNFTAEDADKKLFQPCHECSLGLQNKCCSSNGDNTRCFSCRFCLQKRYFWRKIRASIM